MNPIIKKERSVYSNPLFTVKKFEAVLPDGKEKNFEMIDIQNAVTVLPIDDQKNLYFVEQYRIGAGRALLELPAGKIESGEDPSLCARRELREETGMDAKEIISLGNFFMTPGYANEFMYCFLAKGLFPAPLTPDPDEFINVHKIPASDLPELIQIGKIVDGKTLAILYLAKDQME